MHAFKGRTRKSRASWHKSIERYQTSMRGGYINTALLLAVGFSDAEVAAVHGTRKYVIHAIVDTREGHLDGIRFNDDKMWPSFQAALCT